MLSADNIDTFRWLLHPVKYKSWTTSDKETGMLAPSEANKFIPPILKLLQLKRTSAIRIDNVPDKGSYRIDAEIPLG